MQSTLEGLGVYRCLSCHPAYFFALDVADHEKETGHRDFVVLDLDLDQSPE